MNTSLLEQKLAEHKLTFSPPILDLMQRVREHGLHKVASHLYNTKEFNVKVAVQLLGERLYTKDKKYQKIASGLRVLKVLEELEATKTANIGRMPTALNRNPSLANRLRQVVSNTDIPANIPSSFGGPLNKGSSGMFQAFDAAPKPNFNPKSTLRGQESGELPAISFLPSGQ